MASEHIKDKIALLNKQTYVNVYISKYRNTHTHTESAKKKKRVWFCSSFIYQKPIVTPFTYHKISVFQYYSQPIWEEDITKIQYADKPTCYIYLFS